MTRTDKSSDRGQQAQRQSLNKVISPDMKKKVIAVQKQLIDAFTLRSKIVINKMETESNGNVIQELAEDFCALTRLLSSEAHDLQMQIDWGLPETPEWMNHFQDWYYQSLTKGATFWLERGIFARLCFRSSNISILELCCGDGFNTKNFYAPYAKKIIAVDFDVSAIRHAKKYNSGANIDYYLADIRHEFPQGKFDNVIWDAAIEHFSDDETIKIMRSIKSCLSTNGVLAGYTLVEAHDQNKSLHQHEREFKGKDDLRNFLGQFFLNAKVFETVSKERHNLYFFASDNGILPFDNRWPNQCEIRNL
jgi:SAM-dependent methyltransferase